ncbi:1,4-alpha-glucan branching protein GlgB [Tannockella kyphosi]|uniref:1,4-alpha-glucan branching protein GlgB n=1 Tax=Tannockella kyphosi TaxID=2899121 RepID=UPI0020126C99|nr:1,4-alpha-glucan branching protein GlgB [Tannockella kyphosi]
MLDRFLVQMFHEGQCLEAYKIFGAHPMNHENKQGVRFCVYAPNAKKVAVVGEFNNWEVDTHCLEKKSEGIWEVFVAGVAIDCVYKYAITTSYDQVIYKSDPYAFSSEVRPHSASVVADVNSYQWDDAGWLENQDKLFDKKLTIYEMHFGSWKMKEEPTIEEDGIFFNYDELIDKIIPYVIKMGYTHIELMPLLEHPFDGSWGYQSTGYFSATSRYGKPQQLMAFIDACHQAGVGVIMDFVPVHFVKDIHGLVEFDGGCVYEYPDMSLRYSEWDSVYFDLGREEVRSFMMSAVHFWIDVYHFDGIRFDAVSHLIYYKGNKENGENRGAIEFMKRMSYKLNERVPRAILIAEDSTDYPKVTRSSQDGGLGFDYKWDLGWMNDTLKYMSLDPVHRQYHHHLMTFSMAYFYGENYILPFSHDEVVHSKGTVIDKIHGDYSQKLAQLKTLYMYMYSHPGKKLNFMGNELGEYKEWDESMSLGWNILEYPVHDSFHRYIRELQQFVLHNPCMYEYDYYMEGFEWLVVDDNQQSVFAYERRDKLGQRVVVVMNFTGNYHNGYKIPVVKEGLYTEAINSDKGIYSGGNKFNKEPIQAIKENVLGKEYFIPVIIAPYASMIFTWQEQIRGKKDVHK